MTSSQCIALASSSGRRCRLPAEPGSLFCSTPEHHAGGAIARDCAHLLEDGSLVTGAVEEPTPSPAPPAGDAPDPVAAIEELQEAPAPEEEEASRAYALPDPDPSVLELDPELFAPPPQAQGGAAPASESGGPSRGSVGLAELHPGPWSPEQVRRILLMATGGILERAGKDSLSEAELDFGADAWAAWANQMAAGLDPNRPSHAVTLWCLVVLGTRFAPDAFAWASRKVRRAPAGSAPAQGPAPRERAEAASAPPADDWIMGKLP